jgi:predicted enzyme related to lactoylglutathione lyase
MPIVDPVPYRFCWFELGTTDRVAAEAFYKALFGWDQTTHDLGPGGKYTIFKIGDQDVAATYELDETMRAHGVPTHWMVYVAVPDADAAAAKAASLGAKIVQPPFNAGTNGRMSVLQDPTGAMFCVWQTLSHPGVRLVGGAGTAVWADLSTPDQMRAVTFYGALFGWKLVDGKNMAMAQPGDYAHIVNGDQFIGGIQPAAHRPPNTPAYWLTYFEVENIEATVATIRSLGGRIFQEPMQMEDVRKFAVAGDPQGATFALVQQLRHDGTR